MHITNRLFHACRITLFTRANCSLCSVAKQTLSEVWDTRPFDYQEIDIMKPENKSWLDVYEFDAPVIHIVPSSRKNQHSLSSTGIIKLMHRFSAQEVKAQLDIAQQSQT